VAYGDRGSVRRQGRRLIAKEASGGGVGCRRGEVADGCGGDDAAATAGWRSGGGGGGTVAEEPTRGSQVAAGRRPTGARG
jgi:hypothetical protein